MIVSSSIDVKNYRSSLNYYRQLMSGGNLITVGPNCGGATLDFSQFMESCLGVTVQRTTTLTATFTETVTFSSGFTTMTVAGCTPTGFKQLYPNCHDIAQTQFLQENTTDDYTVLCGKDSNMRCLNPSIEFNTSVVLNLTNPTYVTGDLLVDLETGETTTFNYVNDE